MGRLIRYISILLIFGMVICCGKESEPSDENLKNNTIYGVIADFATGEPVQSANVQLRPSGETTLTGYDGTYEFLDISDGTYSITISKAEYTDLIDDYPIVVKNGKRVKRDVQIQKKPTSIRVTDMNGKDISMLDYGSDASLVSKSFNIFNNGTVSVNCKVTHTCNWISSVSSIPSSITPGQTVPVIVGINRALLTPGQNTSNITISTNNGSAEITVKANSSSGNPPVVQISQIASGSITATSVLCEGRIQDAKRGTISDCGFCYDKASSPSLEDYVVRLGPMSGSFSYTIGNLEPGTTYHIRAFATSNLGTGYSSDITFKTASGLPTCGATTVSILDPTAAMAESSASSTGGYQITEKGFCWSTHSSPTTNDNVVKSGAFDGIISGMLYPLQPNTTYRVRSYAKSEFGVSYGAEKVFTSSSGLATVSTVSATISGGEVITGGNITDNAGTAIIDRGVCYGSGSNPDLSNSFQHTYDGYGEGRYTSRIPKPSKKGYLYIRAYATTKYGTAYGNQVSIYIQ